MSYQKYIIYLCIIMMVCVGCNANHKVEQKEKASVTLSLSQEKSPIILPEEVRKFTMIEEREKKLELVYESYEYEKSYEYWKIKVPNRELSIVDTESMLKFYQQVLELPLKKVENRETVAKEKKELRREITIEYAKDRSAKAKYIVSYAFFVGKDGTYYVEVNGRELFVSDKEKVQNVWGYHTFDLCLHTSIAIPIERICSVGIIENGKNWKVKRGEKEFESIYKAMIKPLVEQEIQQEKEGENLLEITLVEKREDEKYWNIQYRSYDNDFVVMSINSQKGYLIKKSEYDAMVCEVFQLLGIQ